MATPIFETSIKSLPLLGRGKVRDIYAVDADKLLIVTSDRLSAFDVILPDPIPDKGRVLVALANFWFDRLGHILPNQLTGIDPETVVAADEREQVRGRALVVKRLKPLPIEAVVRGYVIGSGWKIPGHRRDLRHRAAGRARQAAKLPAPIFTPSSKADMGEHDENISVRAGAGALRGADEGRARRHRQDRRPARRGGAPRGDRALFRGGRVRREPRHHHRRHQVRVRHRCRRHAAPDRRGAHARSSRFWPADSYREGISPPSFDKQYVRDYLETLDWNKAPPAPTLPAHVIEHTAGKVREAYERLTGQTLG